MNRRLFLQSSLIIAAPAFVSATGIYRGATELLVKPKLVTDMAYLIRCIGAYSEATCQSFYMLHNEVAMGELLTRMKAGGFIDMEKVIYFEKAL